MVPLLKDLVKSEQKIKTIPHLYERRLARTSGRLRLPPQTHPEPSFWTLMKKIPT